jgi:hypothetical protein
MTMNTAGMEKLNKPYTMTFTLAQIALIYFMAENLRGLSMQIPSQNEHDEIMDEALEEIIIKTAFSMEVKNGE